MKSITIVIGTRPNFIKITRFREVFAQSGYHLRIVHTNQHFDDQMSKVFFEQFGIKIDSFIAPYNGKVCAQLGHIMSGLETEFEQFRPDLVLVVGDVNSTLAGSLVANKMNLPLAHVESGLRSFDRSMPEEINRMLTDAVSDYFFVTENAGMENLKREGKDMNKVFFVGNTMIDTLVRFSEKIESSPILKELELEEKSYCLLTFHRPSNVDTPEKLKELAGFIQKLASADKVVFPVHPRTKNRLVEFGLFSGLENTPGVILCDSLDYFSFQRLIKSSVVVITDSGGVQEETTFLQVPCLTLRENTERPVTIEIGTNELCEFDTERLLSIVRNRSFKKGEIPELWDGHATERIVKCLPLIFNESV